MKNFFFTDNYECSNEAFVAILDKIESESQLLDELCQKCDFPDYFGHNWDALFECLRDFQWIDEEDIILIHHQVPDIDKNQLRIYLEILIDTVYDWENGEPGPFKPHSFTVVFPKDSEEMIMAYIGEYEIDRYKKIDAVTHPVIRKNIIKRTFIRLIRLLGLKTPD